MGGGTDQGAICRWSERIRIGTNQPGWVGSWGARLPMGGAGPGGWGPCDREMAAGRARARPHEALLGSALGVESAGGRSAYRGGKLVEQAWGRSGDVCTSGLASGEMGAGSPEGQESGHRGKRVEKNKEGVVFRARDQGTGGWFKWQGRAAAGTKWSAQGASLTMLRCAVAERDAAGRRRRRSRCAAVLGSKRVLVVTLKRCQSRTGQSWQRGRRPPPWAGRRPGPHPA